MKKYVVTKDGEVICPKELYEKYKDDSFGMTSEEWFWISAYLHPKRYARGIERRVEREADTKEELL